MSGMMKRRNPGHGGPFEVAGPSGNVRHLAVAVFTGRPGTGTLSFFQGLSRQPMAAMAFLLGMLTILPAPAQARDPSGYGAVAQEIECLALAIYFESRGEPDAGQRAVGHVVMNRMKDDSFPGSVCEVVREGGQEVLHRCQFSWWCDGKSTVPANPVAWTRSMALARAIFWGFSDDPTAGALWFHAEYVDPSWNSRFVRGPQIGLHIFYTRPTGKSVAKDSPQIAQNP